MRTSVLLLLVFVAPACVTKTFPYSPDLDDTGKAKQVSRHISAEGGTFIWSGCDKAMDDALKRLRSQMRTGESLVKVEYYDYERKQYSGETTCLKETGWVWAVYTFWWPWATKVGVRGTLVGTPSSDPMVTMSDNVKSGAKTHKALSLKKPLSIASYQVDTTSEKYGRNFVQLKLRIQNNGAERVTAFKLKVQISTKLKDRSHVFELTSNSSSIDSLGSEDAVFAWEDNQFIKNEVYDWLASISTENLVVSLVDQQVVKADTVVSH